MKRQVRKFNAYIKGVILWLQPGFIFGFLSNPLLFSSNLLSLTKWIAEQQKRKVYSDFYVPDRDHERRYLLHDHILNKESLANLPIIYLEFGVSQGHSFRWWTNMNRHAQSAFYGFDTFEGLPEAWGTYREGAMAAPIPDLDDPRAKFFKGLFQDTLVSFLKEHSLDGKKKVIHLDADLFSSTLFVLTTLARELKSGDILLFDEFNVPNHEWMAYKVFTESFYVKTKLLGAVNNYYQVGFRVI
ncbi:MAG: class I SAM-dependent methyltransferase [Bacteroidota bacterium]|nr:class I SAM-dependent methyltransferase [Bacteroidota bacterium]